MRWTAEHRKAVREMRAAGREWGDIGKEMGGLSADAVRCAMSRGGEKSPPAVGSVVQLSPGGATGQSVATGPASCRADSIPNPPLAVQPRETYYPLDQPLPEKQPSAPAVHTSKSRSGNFLCISDPQEPYALEDAVAFCRRVRAEFNIPVENAVHMGDEADHMYGSRFPVDPDNDIGPLGELKWLRVRMKIWFAEHQKMRVCTSNHSDRWYKKASGAQIPSQLIRARHEILEAPEGWVWADSWDFRDGKMPWRAEHGHNGATNTKVRAIENGISTAHGHFHAKAGAEWTHTAGGQLVWGLATGCLIDANAIAFKYNKKDRYKPIIGVGVVLDGGTKPLFVPYDR